MINECKTRADYEQLLESSLERPVFLFKHSTRCPISAGRWRAYQDFAQTHSQAVFYRVLVIEDRALVQQIAEATSIRHESPQAILFYRGEPIWHASHWAITDEAMAEALVRATSG